MSDQGRSDNGRRDELARIEALTLALLDDEDALGEAELDELDRLVAGSAACAARHRALVAQEIALRGERAELELSQATLARIEDTVAGRVEGGVMDAIRASAGAGVKQAVAAIETGWTWLGGRRFWQLAGATAALLVVLGGLQWGRVASLRAEPHEALLYGRSLLSPGASASYRVLVRDGQSGQPIAGASVRVALYDPRQGNDRPLWHSAASKTDADGLLLVTPKVAADLADGTYQLRVETRSPKGEATLRHSVQIKRAYKVMLTTDKPLYQPGQTIRIRALALRALDLRPAARQPIALVVKDAKGNKVFKKNVALSRFGIASADFALADQVNQGRYTLAATVGEATSERTVEVERYRLPRFGVKLTTARAYYGPGDRVEGELVAAYTFGKPVAGAKVTIRALRMEVDKLRPLHELSGLRTDAAGKLRFSLPLPRYLAGLPVKGGDALVTIEAEVKDAAGHAQRKAHELTVTNRPIRVAALPESGRLVAGVENRVYVVTAYADGRPAETELSYRLANDTAPARTVRTSSAGVAEITVTPPAGVYRAALELVARDGAGLRVESHQPLDADGRVNALLLRTDRAIYGAGQTVRVELRSPARRGRIFVDVVKERRTQLVKALDVEDGRAVLDLDLPPGLFGTLELHAYRIARDGAIVGDARVIQVNRADQLTISARLDRKRYRPAEKAVLEVAVSRADGTPAQVALGLAGVDEAVFALHELQPGLARVYFTLQQELLKPRYEIHGIDGARLSPDQLTSAKAEVTVDPRASAALFSAAEGQAAPERVAGETFHQRDGRLRSERRRGYHALWGGAAIALFVVFSLLVAPTLCYALSRLWRRETIPAAEEAERLAELGRALRWPAVWWALGFYLPLLGLFVGSWLVRGRDGRTFGLGLAVGLLVTALVMLWRAVARARRHPLAAAVPRLRAALLGLPAALVCAPLLLGALIASQGYPRGLAEDAAVALVLAALALAALVAALLPVARRSVLRSTSALRWLVEAAWRLVLIGGLPALALLFVVFAVGRSAEMGPVAALALQKTADGAGKFVSFGLPRSASTSDGRGGLKAPSRVRRHFPETLIWRPEVITDTRGRARLEIPLADSITTWRLSLSAVSDAGELGATVKPLTVFQPFFVELELPVALTQHDEIEVPVAIYSYLDKPQTVRLDLGQKPWFRLVGPPSRTVRLAPKQVTSVRFRLVALQPGAHALTVKAHGSELADAIERKVRVEPDGKRVVRTINGRLDGKGAQVHAVRIPQRAIAGASDLLVKLHPGAFSQVVEGLDSIFRMPYGCFEQTSSTTYPNVLVLDYMRRTKQVRPAVELKALRYINLGYQRLLSFEVDGGGFEWFGKPPAHNVLTAYGLMEFADMARVYPGVDPMVIARTRRFLLEQQQSDGGWMPTGGGIAEGAINRYRTQALRTTAYITWALLESLRGADGKPAASRDHRIDRALDRIAREARAEDDPYTLATCANALVAAGRAEAKAVLDRLLSLQQQGKSGGVYWASKAESVTYSRGPVLAIETTALAANALLSAGREIPVAHRALSWLVSQKDARGTWHSTQATVLALRALLAGAASGAELKGPARVVVAVDGKAVKQLTVTPETADVVRLVSLRERVHAGETRVSLTLEGRGALAYQVVATHYLPWAEVSQIDPLRAREQELSIDVEYNTTRLATSDLAKVHVTLRYNKPGTARMLIADLGVPPGFAVVTAGLESLKERGLIERYTLTGRQLTLYIRELASGKPLTLDYELRAKYPVKAIAPRSRLYKYYEPEVRAETRPVELTVL